MPEDYHSVLSRMMEDVKEVVDLTGMTSRPMPSPGMRPIRSERGARAVIV